MYKDELNKEHNVITSAHQDRKKKSVYLHFFRKCVTNLDHYIFAPLANPSKHIFSWRGGANPKLFIVRSCEGAKRKM